MTPSRLTPPGPQCYGAGVVVAFLLLGRTLAAPGQAVPADWTLRTRLELSGNSTESEPPGYAVYSGIALEVAVNRRWGHVASELGVRTESREVDFDPGSGPAIRLGALELLPVTWTVQYRFRNGAAIRPYLGAGLNLTLAWEKSGVLDSMDVAPHLGPALQGGVDIGVGRRAAVNIDLRWNTLTSDVRNGGARFAKLRIDPVAIGVGVALPF